MKENDNALFKQAFDELENEGFFKDFNAKAKGTRASANKKTKAGSAKLRRAVAVKSVSKPAKKTAGKSRAK
jgi:hypothetical protein